MGSVLSTPSMNFCENIVVSVCVQDNDVVGTRITRYNSCECGTFQAALKVDQNDAKLRLVAIEKQMAALQAKAKVGWSYCRY